ncbi:MAG: L,D-transpeptidase family protein [Bacteroidota bacterium]|nr:L,D-transpeptidase family protein [Bacteroidota bacterium]
MKTTFILALASLFFFASCNSQNKKVKKDSDTTSSETNKKEKKISKRDYSIGSMNAYNNLFLDSNTVENYISKNNFDQSLSRRMRSFYNTRNYEFAWFSPEGLTQQAFGFWSLKNYSGDTAAKSKNFQSTMESLMADTDLIVRSTDQSIINTELRLTQYLIDYTKNNYEKGYVKRKEVERFVPFKKVDPIYVADSLLNKKHHDDKYFADVNTDYSLLKDQLQKYLAIAKHGGWPLFENDPKKYKEGNASPGILNMKKMLFITGDLPATDTTFAFNDNLKEGIKNFQKRFGYTPDGVVSSSLLKEMNVPAIDRVKQLLINMDRMRWMPQEPAGKLILVNIPEFVLHVRDGKNKVLDMAVVVGKEGHTTTIFSDKLTTIVFSPYWNIPSSIVKKEILPSIAKNANYLESHNMEQYGGTSDMPEIRQKPGEDNSLGKVKFLFPNSFNIYFHDTPAKSLFSKDQRAYSHGCIRLSEPAKLAEYLLKDDSKWTPEKIDEAMNSDEEKYVSIGSPVPVFITYYTTWVDDSGTLNFRADIYGHDKEIASKMFGPANTSGQLSSL